MKIQITKDNNKIEEMKLLKIEKEEVKEKNFLKIPEGVTTIGKEACNSLNDIEGLTIYLPASVKLIEENAFEGLNINYINFSENIEKVGRNAFSSCIFNKKIILPQSVITKGNRCFESSTFKDEVVMVEGIESINSEMFKKCIFDKKVILPKTVKKIEAECFCHAVFKDGIELSDDLKSISYKAFSRAKLNNIKLPKGLKHIYSGAFDGCHLKECKIPENVVHIGRYAFSFCDLTEVKIPPLAEMDNYAFEYNKLKMIYLSEQQCIELTRQKKYVFIGNEEAQIYIYENDYKEENVKETTKRVKRKILK